MIASCSGCDKGWTGANMAHCGVCHETFSCVPHFEAHRSSEGEHGSCIDLGGVVFPEAHKRAGERVYRTNDHGVWTANVDKPTFWEEGQ